MPLTENDARSIYRQHEELDIHFEHLETVRKALADHEVQYGEIKADIISPDHLTTSNFKTAMKQKSHKIAKIIKELVTGL